MSGRNFCYEHQWKGRYVRSEMWVLEPLMSVRATGGRATTARRTRPSGRPSEGTTHGGGVAPIKGLRGVADGCERDPPSIYTRPLSVSHLERLDGLHDADPRRDQVLNNQTPLTLLERACAKGGAKRVLGGHKGQTRGADLREERKEQARKHRSKSSIFCISPSMAFLVP
jgi:hypothetical protein